MSEFKKLLIRLEDLEVRMASLESPETVFKKMLGMFDHLEARLAALENLPPDTVWNNTAPQISPTIKPGKWEPS